MSVKKASKVANNLDNSVPVRGDEHHAAVESPGNSRICHPILHRSHAIHTSDLVVIPPPAAARTGRHEQRDTSAAAYTR